MTSPPPRTGHTPRLLLDLPHRLEAEGGLWALGGKFPQQRAVVLQCTSCQCQWKARGPCKSLHTISKIYLQHGKMKLSICSLRSIQEVALLTVL
jgi:hypothetical protein